MNKIAALTIPLGLSLLALTGCRNGKPVDATVNALTASCSVRGCDLNLNTTLTDLNGEPVQEKLDPEDFVFTELNIEYVPDTLDLTIDEAVVDDIKAEVTDAERVVAGLLLDQSGSIIGNDEEDLRIDATQAMAASLLTTETEHELALMTFPRLYGVGEDFLYTDLWVEPTRDAQAISEAADDLADAEGGGTPLFASMTEVLNYLDDYNSGDTATRALVVMTDGDDSSSYDEALSTARDLDIPVYIVGLGSGVNVAKLQGFAEPTGGLYLSAQEPDRLAEVFTGLVGALYGSVDLEGEVDFTSSSDDLRTGTYRIWGTVTYKKDLDMDFDSEVAVVVE